jgi:carbohydrate binding protein with CBM4/9 domain/glycosyl hydrolase family 26
MRFPLGPSGRSLALAAALVAGLTGGAVVSAGSTALASPNLLSNGGFEGTLQGWQPTGSGSPRFSLVTAAHSGTYSVAVRNLVGGANTVLNDSPNSVKSSTKGAVYTATAWVRTPTPNTGVKLRLTEYQGSQSLGQADQWLYLTDSDWHQMSVSYTSVKGGSIDFNVWAPALAGDHVFNVDDAVLTSSADVAPSTAPTPSPTATTPPPAPEPQPTPTNPSPSATPTPSPTATTPAPAPSPTLTSSTCTVSADLVPSCGAWWGIYKKPDSGWDWAAALIDMEGQVGRKFDIFYRYFDFSDTSAGHFPDVPMQNSAAGGRIPVVSWEPETYANHSWIPWADIASGKYDAVIDGEAQRLKTWGKKVIVGFDPEMDMRVGTNGSAADYVAAYRHIHDRFDADGVTNVLYMWTITGSKSYYSTVPSLYPGDSYVDWIGYDPYNFFTCNGSTWKTYSQTVDPAYQWLMNNGHGNKPFILAEYGSAIDSNNSQAVLDWYTSIPTVLKAHPNIKAVMQWDDGHTCNSRLTAQSGELDAFAQAGHDPYVNQSH